MGNVYTKHDTLMIEMEWLGNHSLKL